MNYCNRFLEPFLVFYKILIAVNLVFITGCNPGAVPEDMSLLNLRNDSLEMAMELDSLQQLLLQRNLQFDTINSNYSLVVTDLEKANNQIKNLRSGYYARGQQVKKLKVENEGLSKKAGNLDRENDSLKLALNLIQQELIESESIKSVAENKNDSLAAALIDKENQRIADSLALVNMFTEENKSGFVSITEAGGGFGLANTSVDYSRSVLSINTVAGYRVNDRFVTGFGTGLSVYNGGMMIPLYLDFRYMFTDWKFRPYLNADGGFLFVLKDFSTSGIFINPLIGFEKKINDKFSFHISSGMLMQTAPSGPTSGGFRRTFINFKAGISFKGK